MSKTFSRLKKIITKGYYTKEEFLLDLSDYLALEVLTQEEYDELILLLEESEPMENYDFIVSSEYNDIISENTYTLLKRQIAKKSYAVNIIKQMVADFKITNSINRYQFTDLVKAINKEYYNIDDSIQEDIDLPFEDIIIEEPSLEEELPTEEE